MNAAAPSTPPKVIDRDEEARKYSKKIEVCTTFVERDATGLLFNQQVEGTRPARPNLYANVFLYRQGNVNQTPHYCNLLPFLQQ